MLILRNELLEHKKESHQEAIGAKRDFNELRKEFFELRKDMLK